MSSAGQQIKTKAASAGVDGSEAIVLAGVVSTIGEFPVLAGVDLRVARGEVVLVSDRMEPGRRACSGS